MPQPRVLVEHDGQVYVATVLAQYEWKGAGGRWSGTPPRRGFSTSRRAGRMSCGWWLALLGSPKRHHLRQREAGRASPMAQSRAAAAWWYLSATVLTR